MSSTGFAERSLPTVLSTFLVCAETVPISVVHGQAVPMQETLGERNMAIVGTASVRWAAEATAFFELVACGDVLRRIPQSQMQ